jgi:hypothetical protein
MLSAIRIDSSPTATLVMVLRLRSRQVSDGSSPGMMPWPQTPMLSQLTSTVKKIMPRCSVRLSGAATATTTFPDNGSRTTAWRERVRNAFRQSCLNLLSAWARMQVRQISRPFLAEPPSLTGQRGRDDRPQTRRRSPCCSTVERARHLGADFACVFRDGPQLRLKVFGLNSESFLEILRTQKLFHEVIVCCNSPLKVCLESRYSFFIGTRKASHGLCNHVDVALRRALHLFEIFQHHGLNGFKRVLFVSMGSSSVGTLQPRYAIQISALIQINRWPLRSIRPQRASR